jgi:hypothetical protein
MKRDFADKIKIRAILKACPGVCFFIEALCALKYNVFLWTVMVMVLTLKMLHLLVWYFPPF